MHNKNIVLLGIMVFLICVYQTEKFESEAKYNEIIYSIVDNNGEIIERVTKKELENILR